MQYGVAILKAFDITKYSSFAASLSLVATTMSFCKMVAKAG
jgi:hypothetical protein